jgi:hypothetical protein
MKKTTVMIVALFAFTAPAASFAAMGHGDHGAMEGGHAGHQGNVAHEEVVEGVKATFTVQTMKDAMKAMGMEMPKGVKETHHISVAFKDARSGKALTEGEVKIKVQNPDKSNQTRELMGMQGHFGADFDFSKKGKYGVMAKFKLKDGKVRSAKFWYTAK